MPWAGVVNVITKKPTQTPEATFFGTYGGGEDIDAIQNYRLTHAYKVGPLGYSLLSCYVENLFDEAYEEQFGYSMPGFIVGAEVKLSL
jgi:outer membrane receptor protein involved in Fe transport